MERGRIRVPRNLCAQIVTARQRSARQQRSRAPLSAPGGQVSFLFRVPSVVAPPSSVLFGLGPCSAPNLALRNGMGCGSSLLIIACPCATLRLRTPTTPVHHGRRGPRRLTPGVPIRMPKCSKPLGKVDTFVIGPDRTRNGEGKPRSDTQVERRAAGEIFDRELLAASRSI